MFLAANVNTVELYLGLQGWIRKEGWWLDPTQFSVIFFLVKLGCKLEKQIPYLGLIGLILCERVRTKQEGQRRHQFQEIASPPPRFHSTVVFCLQARLYCYFCSYLVRIFWVKSRGRGSLILDSEQKLTMAGWAMESAPFELCLIKEENPDCLPLFVWARATN